MRKLIKQASLLVALVALTSASFAQGVVKGTVVDATTNEPLIGATVIIDGTTQGTAASLDGTFTLKVSTATAKLLIRFVGYQDEVKEITVSGDMNIGKVGLKTSSIGMDEIIVTANIARDRQTPVAIANIKAQLIEDKLGTQEFPEILKSTPSVYATKAGGGYGDGRINLRGFDSNNIGVLINGVPINDMESGKVYWSNWAGLSDVTRTMQVQRGMGASKLALSSVGGTINIVTQSTEAKEGGIATYAMGNDGFAKKSFTVSTGMLKNGWAVTMSGARTSGDGYVKGTAFDGYSYFLNVSKRINDNHQVSFTVFGAPQWHNQRFNRSLIQTYRDDKDGIRMNLDYGYRNGKEFSTSKNYYHKPQMSVNHFWKINDKTSLSTAAYASIAKGGGTRLYSASKGSSTVLTRTAENLLDFDKVIADNKASLTGSQIVLANAINSHDWYGILSSLNTKISDFSITGGLDARYYKGYHAYQIEDLFGGNYYLDNANKNNAVGTPLKKGDYIYYNYIGQVLWLGGFAQAEYVKDNYSAFLSGSVSNTGYRRQELFSNPQETTKWANFLGYSIKGGANYNINENHNVFVNAGYFTRAPYFSSVFNLRTSNIQSPEATNEKILSTEFGYGFRSSVFSGNVTVYRTAWTDKSVPRSGTNQDGTLWFVNISGMDALHQGVELDFSYKPFEKFTLNGMLSVGDWRWTSNTTAVKTDEAGNPTMSGLNPAAPINVYAKDLHVGDAAQTTASVSMDYEVLPKFKLGLDFNHYDNLYAYFTADSRDVANAPDAWKMPDYQLIDFNVKYDFKMGIFNATILGNVNNILDTEYISDANDGVSHTYKDATGYFGSGRTWSTTLKIRF